jgi:hypothetical protein
MSKMIRRYMLQHAHPMKFAAEVLGVMWAVYFLWRHSWIGAVGVAIASFLLSTLLLWRKKQFEYLADTPLGRIILIYTSPINFVLYNLSAIPFVYGIWTHNYFYILIGISLLLLPHLWGWKGSKLKGKGR